MVIDSKKYNYNSALSFSTSSLAVHLPEMIPRCQLVALILLLNEMYRQTAHHFPSIVFPHKLRS